jgi:ATP-binding cassette subfamily B (MDR/TAP) protein 1
MNVLFAVIIGGFESGQAAPNFAAITTAQVAAAAAFSVIDRTPAIDQAPEDEGFEPPPDKSVAGELALNKVVFAYPTRPTVRVMDGTSITFPAGKSMALVGSSGSGKSTIVQMLQRFYDPQEGSVTMDGTDLRSLNLRWVRRHMGLVSQEPALFSGTIRQNIAYGREDASEEEIDAAARAANAAGFISQLPMGFDTQTGERGVQLSGGQKQRVAIARAVLRNPRILLLDEATSALDSESERVVQSALDALIAAGGRTSIIIAHRLSTIRDSDCITVLSKGLVVQQGTHAAMSSDASGAYAALLAAQQGQHFDEAGPALAAAESSARTSMDGKRMSLDGKSVLEVDIVHEAGTDAATEADSTKDIKVPFSRLWKLGASRAHLLPIGAIGAMVNGAIMPCFALALASIIAAFFLPPDDLREEVAKWCLIFLGISVGAFIAMVLQTWALGTIAAELALNARREVFAAIVRMEASWFDRAENSSGRLASRLEEDTVNLRGAVGDNVAVAVQNMTVMAGGLAIAFAYSWKLTLVILACLPVLMAGAVVQMKVLMGGVGGENSKLYATANQMLSDALSNVRTVAAYGLSRNMVGLYTQAQEGPSEQLQMRANINGLAFGFGQGMFVLLYALSFWYGGYLVDRGEVEPGAVFKTFFAVVRMRCGYCGPAERLPARAFLR